MLIQYVITFLPVTRFPHFGTIGHQHNLRHGSFRLRRLVFGRPRRRQRWWDNLPESTTHRSQQSISHRSSQVQYFLTFFALIGFLTILRIMCMNHKKTFEVLDRRFEMDGQQFCRYYYLVVGIYPDLSRFVKTIPTAGLLWNCVSSWPPLAGDASQTSYKNSLYGDPST